MRLLVTGGAGYIGSIVAAQLIDAGHEVVVLDNLQRGHRSAVPAGAEFVQGDVRDREAVVAAVDRDVEAVLHFAAAALVGESVAQPELYWHINVVGTLNLLERMREREIPRLVFSSTAAVYGQPDRVPITENAPVRPTNTYGASKLTVDQMISTFCTAYELGAISLRYFNVAGASGELGEDHHPETHLIPNILRAAAGVTPEVEVFGTDYDTPDGTAIRDYIHIEDLSGAHLLALDAIRPGEHGIFNLGNGSGYSVRQVIETAREVTGREIPVRESARRPGDPPNLVASSERARAELGWTPRKPELSAMVGDAWAFVQTHPDGYPD